RDVSPANVLVSRWGAAKLADFGVAKAAVRGGRTVAGVIKGNTLYMSPEQLSGGEVDQRTDLYATGMVLLTMVAGRHPFASEAIGQILDRILSGRIPRASELGPVPAELDAIIARATAKNRDERFGSARAFLDALDAFVSATDALAGAPELSVLVDALSPEHDPPTLVTEPPEDQPSIVARMEALFEGSEGSVETSTDDATPAWSALSNERTPTQESLNEPPPGPATLIEDPEVNEPTAPGHTPVPQILREQLESRPHELTPMAIEPPPVIVPGNPSVAPTVITPQFVARETPDGVLKGHRGAVSALGFLGAGALAVSASHDGTVRVWEIGSREERACMKGHRGAVTSLSVASDGTRVLTGGRDRTLRLWDAATGRETRLLEGHLNWVFAVDLDEKAQLALSGGLDRMLRVWDLAGRGRDRVIPAHSDAIAAVALVGGHAVTGGYDRTVRVWDLDTGTEWATLQSDRGVRAIAVSHDRRRAVSGGADSLVTTWDLARGQLVHRLDGHIEPVVAVAFTPDGKHVVSGSYDGTARLWDVSIGARRAIFGGQGEPVMSVAVSPDGAFFLAGRADGTIEIWSLRGAGR
ncbi:MAG TPA: serine/threonine-protein kinase, partial [bacterium]|nr:serine/threonine-protein kinase [bacterium]